KLKGFDGTDIHDMLIWRRAILATECSGSLDKFHQEYPTTPEEAFVATGSHVFDLRQLRAVYEPELGDKGKLIPNRQSFRFIETPDGPLTIYRYPSPHEDYLIGGHSSFAAVWDYGCLQVVNRR